MKPELKPCPFCGATEDSKPGLYLTFSVFNLTKPRIECLKCGVRGSAGADSIETAGEEWNKMAE